MPRTHAQILPILILVMIMAGSLPSTTYASADEPIFATTHDAIIFDSSCLNSTSCVGERVEHLVEYYGADWCEPCELIEEEIEALNRSDTFVIQHHPSVVDTSFLSASKLRFENEHRLLFLPSLVIDGEELLTGSSQALELSNVLSQRSTSFSGLSNIRTRQWKSYLECITRRPSECLANRVNRPSKSKSNTSNSCNRHDAIQCFKWFRECFESYSKILMEV